MKRVIAVLVTLAVAVVVGFRMFTGCTEPTASAAATTSPHTTRPPFLDEGLGERMKREWRGRDAQRRAEVAEIDARQVRADRLADAMRDYIVEIECARPVAFCRAHPHARNCPANPERACRVNRRQADQIVQDRDLRGFAVFIHDLVHRRVEEGLWVPLSPEKAPGFLAAIAYHEGSWRWARGSKLRAGTRGERCTFQVMGTNAAKAGFTLQEVASDPYACATAAIDTMRRCEENCGAGAERWMGQYASGHCGWARDVVDERMETARWLLRSVGTATQ